MVEFGTDVILSKAPPFSVPKGVTVEIFEAVDPEPLSGFADAFLQVEQPFWHPGLTASCAA